jgi:hypothetical protein
VIAENRAVAGGEEGGPPPPAQTESPTPDGVHAAVPFYEPAALAAVADLCAGDAGIQQLSPRDGPILWRRKRLDQGIDGMLSRLVSCDSTNLETIRHPRDDAARTVSGDARIVEAGHGGGLNTRAQYGVIRALKAKRVRVVARASSISRVGPA